MPRGPICKRRRGCRSVSILGFERRQAPPALVIAELQGDDVILCQITSQTRRDRYPLRAGDFAEGGLRQSSFVRPNRVFTADSTIILYRVGMLGPAKPNFQHCGRLVPE